MDSRVGRALVVMASVLAIGIAGCTDDPELAPDTRPGDYADSARTADFEVYNAAYLDETSKLVLPDHFVWPKRAKKYGLPGDQIMYHIGGGRLDAQRYWFCAWNTEFIRLTNRQETTASKAAADEIQKYREMPSRRWFMDGRAGIHTDQVMDAAKLGDISTVAQFVSSNCTDWWTPVVKDEVKP